MYSLANNKIWMKINKIEKLIVSAKSFRMCVSALSKSVLVFVIEKNRLQLFLHNSYEFVTNHATNEEHNLHWSNLLIRKITEKMSFCFFALFIYYRAVNKLTRFEINRRDWKRNSFLFFLAKETDYSRSSIAERMNRKRNTHGHRTPVFGFAR